MSIGGPIFGECDGHPSHLQHIAGRGGLGGSANLINNNCTFFPLDFANDLPGSGQVEVVLLQQVTQITTEEPGEEQALLLDDNQSDRLKDFLPKYLESQPEERTETESGAKAGEYG